MLVNAVLYEPTAALQIMESSRSGGAQVFFTKWFESIQAKTGVPRVHDKKLTVLALCALLELPASSIPPTIQQGWNNILPAILHVLSELPKAVEGQCTTWRLGLNA